MSEADGILRLRQPISVTYNWSAGPNATSHLNGLLNGTLIGKRCPGCSLVYFPPRNGVCPKCARILGDDVVVGPRGTITTFGRRSGSKLMARRDVAIVGTAQRPNEVGTTLTSVELILPVINEVIAKVGIERREIGFWCHGSCDYMSGQPFSFVAAVDAIGAWPPIIESHVEGDGALALYEAWVKIQTGECDVALVFSNGKTTSGPIDRILNLQADPYMVTPLWPGFDSLAALQARACLDAGIMSEADGILRLRQP
ncbi:MAG: hypothetical protein EBX95_13005, partial [Acidimicrobiia bacterium]|nr:hypothetical protein [Acidimicrobiia bacterium]